MADQNTETRVAPVEPELLAAWLRVRDLRDSTENPDHAAVYDRGMRFLEKIALESPTV